MWLQVVVLSLLIILTAVLQPSQQIFTMNRKSDLLDIVYPPQVQNSVVQRLSITPVLGHWFILQSEKPVILSFLSIPPDPW
jgi:hypothetical protein